MNPTKTLVLLKYNILTSSYNTWKICETYPPEVRKNWAWRCAADCEHFAIGDKEAEHLIEVAKKYRDGLATVGELNSAYSAAPATYSAYCAAQAAYYAANAAATYYTAYAATYYTAYATRAAQAANSAYATHAAHAVNSAAHAAARAAAATKWVLYIEWLIEELCIWEEKQ